MSQLSEAVDKLTQAVTALDTDVSNLLASTDTSAQTDAVNAATAKVTELSNKINPPAQPAVVAEPSAVPEVGSDQPAA